MWPTKIRLQTFFLVMGFFFISLGIIATAFHINTYVEHAVQKQGENELSAIADSKVAQITVWRNERSAEAHSIMQNPFINQSLIEWLRSPDDSLLATNIRQWMLNLEKFYGYSNVALVDTSGSLLLAKTGNGFRVDSSVQRCIHDALVKRDVVFCDLYKSERDGEVHFDAILPIVRQQKIPKYSAALILELTPRHSLFPLIQNWPVPSRTAEVVLMRREGNRVLYLNDLRFWKNSALSLSLPIDKAGFAGAMTVRTTSGIIEGADYRGKSVLAAVRHISGSPWYLEAKIDKKELYAPFRLFSTLISALMLALIVLMGLAVRMIRGTQTLRYYKMLLKAEREQLRLQESLSDEKERLLVTLHSIGDGVIATDVSGRVVLMNKVAEDLTGWSLSEAAGLPLFEVFTIINELTREPCENPVEKVLKTGAIVELGNHTALISRHDQTRIIADSTSPIRHHDGTIIGVVLVFRDITDKHKMEETLQRAQKLESIGVLAGGIAHDFNNLLSGVMGYVDLAYSYAEEGGARQAAQTLAKTRRMFERAKYLTSRLLTFSKGGAPVCTIQPIEKFVIEWVEFTLSGSNIHPQFSIEENLRQCSFDENQMSQVIQNIALNARQAMPSGILEVEITNVPPNNVPPSLLRQEYLRISIRDHGPGIDPKHLSRIFDPFFTTKGEGSGLGLAISYAIVKKHNGIIEVESSLNKGSTFHIYLPASPERNVAVETEEIHPPIEHQGYGKILIMDDEEYIRNLASLALTPLGYTVVEVGNGDDAIRYIKEARQSNDPFIGAIFDLSIPGGRNGADTIQELRLFDPDLPVIASSGYSFHPIMAYPQEYGFNERLVKPYHSNELIEVIQRVLSEQKLKGRIV